MAHGQVRTAAAAVFTLAAVAAAGGCSASVGSGGTAGRSSPMVTSQDGWVSAAGLAHVPLPLPLVPQLAAARASGLTSLPWAELAVDDARYQIAVSYAAGDDCTSFRGVTVTETPSSVTLAFLGATVAVTPDPQMGAVVLTCDLPAYYGTGLVQLAAPLGHRALLHPPADKRFGTPPSGH